MSHRRYIEKLALLGYDGFPTSAHFELTHRCNGSCRYCYLDGEEKEGLPVRLAIDIITTLKNNGILYLFITGGEIFTRPDILTILEHAVACDYFEISLLSNGTLLTDEHLRFLGGNSRHFRRIKFSAFSDDAGENDAYLGIPGALDHTIAAMQTLKQSGIEVSLSLSAQSFNVHRIGEIIDFFECMNFKVNLAPFKITTPRNKAFCEPDTTYDFFRALFAGLGKHRSEEFRSVLDAKLALPHRNLLCNGVACMIMIDPAGTVFPCVSFRKYPLGNILEEPDLKKLFTSDAMVKLHSLTYDDYPVCDKCQYVNFCSICIGRWHTLSGTFGEIDGQLCNFVHALVDATGV